MLVTQIAKILQEFWQAKYLITNQLCTFSGFGGKNFTFESLCEAALIPAKSVIVLLIIISRRFSQVVLISAFIYYVVKFNLYSKSKF